MKRLLHGIILLADSINELVGRVVAWLSTALVVLFCCDVLTRYFFNFTKVWVLEMEWHLFALLFLLAGGYALLHKRHVRVDVLYDKWPAKRQAWVNLIGTIGLLLPWCVMIIVMGHAYAQTSYFIGEGSPNPGGLPHRFVIKYAMVIGMTLLLLQGLSLAAKSMLVLMNAPYPRNES